LNFNTTDGNPFSTYSLCVDGKILFQASYEEMDQHTKRIDLLFPRYSRIHPPHYTYNLHLHTHTERCYAGFMDEFTYAENTSHCFNIDEELLERLFEQKSEIKIVFQHVDIAIEIPKVDVPHQCFTLDGVSFKPTHPRGRRVPILNLSWFCDLALALLQCGVAPYVLLDIIDYICAMRSTLVWPYNRTGFETESQHCHYRKIKCVERIQRRLNVY
jgi:hypothetical protein